MIFTAVGARSAPLDVDFQLTDIQYKPLADQPVRLILGLGQDWQDAGSGNHLVTDANGKAQFSTNVTTEKRWQWVNVGFTPFSIPTRTDYLPIAAELIQKIPAVVGGQDTLLRILYRMDVYRRKDGSCSTTGFTSMFTADAGGRFTVRVPTNGLPIPASGGLVLFGEGYQPWDYMLDHADATKRGWNLKLAFKRLPDPVRR